jgi:alpha,alpha-trehalase
MKTIIFPFLFLITCAKLFAQPTPDKIYGQLFHDVQMLKVFPDGKTFADCTPKRKIADIMYDYGLAQGPNFNLKKFVADNFELPPPPPAFNYVMQEKDVAKHIQQLWGNLKRAADKPVEGSSLLPLPNAYIVPGGRFREVYYWDSYFTMLGLKESGETETIRNMIDNFAYLINTYGHIPNGNRTYYLSRSQPPFFSLMVTLLAEMDGDKVYTKYYAALKKEYAYWTEGMLNLKKGTAFKRLVMLKDGNVLNRYWDESALPRQESYKEDVETAAGIANNKMSSMHFKDAAAADAFKQNSLSESYHHLRGGAASGWDFSSRWFADKKNISTIEVTDIIPVDLNCLLYHLETTLVKAATIGNNKIDMAVYAAFAANRQKAIEKYCYNGAVGFYTDFNFRTNSKTTFICPAGMYAFSLLGLGAKELVEKGAKAAMAIRNFLLKPGGIVSSTYQTGQQWDAPNGWAPLQWMVIAGLEKCGQTELAKDIATRWIKLNNDVYLRTGKLMEKYNVADIHLEAGGGEYPGQDGFGWTNGVLLTLINKYDKEKNYLGSSNKN